MIIENKRISLSLIIVCCSLLLITGLPLKPESLVNWDKLKISWENFLNYPSEKNLKIFYKDLPKIDLKKVSNAEKANVFSNDKGLVKLIIENIEFLEKEIYAGNRAAVRVCFKLQHLILGRWERSKVVSILGNLIRVNSTIFLEELKNHLKTIDDDDLQLILIYYDPYFYTDKVQACLRETQLRIEALERVKNESLGEVKMVCLGILKKEKCKYEKLFEYESKAR